MQSCPPVALSLCSLIPTRLPARTHFPARVKPSSTNVHIKGIERRQKVMMSLTSSKAQAASTEVKVAITVKPSLNGAIPSSKGFTKSPKDIAFDLIGRSFLLELVSAELDTRTGKEKPYIKASARHIVGTLKLEASVEVPNNFNHVGALLVENKYDKEVWVESIVIEGLSSGSVNIVCDSFVEPNTKRIFFPTKSYLPSQTPSGVLRLREEELKNLRGDGKGTRKKGERIYDYDVYNDYGDPDADIAKKRPVLGGKESPYPRRCRTGRAMSKADPLSESRSAYVYVPRDEEFSDVKLASSGITLLSDVLHGAIPRLQNALSNSNNEFASFDKIGMLYNAEKSPPDSTLPQILRTATTSNIFRYDPPRPYEQDERFWLSDNEFSRETLAGLNPCVIKLVETWPLKSDLDVAVYGPAESGITTEIVQLAIGNGITVDNAVEEKKLFIIDHHDLLLPLVSLVRQQKNTTLYGSRALFFLTSQGTLKPLAIELVRPPLDGKPQWKQVFTPSADVSLWRLAKAHFLAHDSGVHELVSHWLRTHCVTEPYIIAANRQMSAMHPIYRLLHPHFRYTMEINALAREALINAGGTIDSSFSPLKYSMKFSSIVYDKQWRFDSEALPTDLIGRGMAVADASSPHGLKLAIEDYPFANDGLLIWDAVKTWVTSYIKHYYPDEALIKTDTELQAWWSEVRNVGHADKKDEPWWPKLDVPDDLIGVVTTIIWMASCHHAAVNFGQYEFGGYFPNRPSIARLNMPTEYSIDSEEYKRYATNPESWLLKTFPSRTQATMVMSVLDTLSLHSSDEEYIGGKMELAWGDDPVIKAAFDKFHAAIVGVESTIDKRNINPQLKNRRIGKVAYEFLKPFSTAGVTNKGVPNSISI